MKTKPILSAALACAVAFTATIARAADPLPSWNEGPAKQSIIEFVAKVTTPGSPDFVPVAERIATFDKRGRLQRQGRGFRPMSGLHSSPAGLVSSRVSSKMAATSSASVLRTM